MCVLPKNINLFTFKPYLPPQGDPAFSYTLAMDDPARDAKGPGFHHVGDVTLSVRPENQAQYMTYSTVSRSQSAEPPAARCGKGVAVLGEEVEKTVRDIPHGPPQTLPAPVLFPAS